MGAGPRAPRRTRQGPGADQCEVLAPVRRSRSRAARKRHGRSAALSWRPTRRGRAGRARRPAPRMVMTGRFSRLAQSEDVGVRSTSPESSTISPIAPTGGSPASRPQVDGCLGVSDALEDSPRLARSGQHMAGADQVDASASGLPRTRSWWLDPPRRSGRDSGRGVHAHGVPVRSGSALFGTIRGSPRRSAHWFGIGAQRKPEVCRPIHPTHSDEAVAAPRWRLLRSRDRGCRGPGRDARRAGRRALRECSRTQPRVTSCAAPGSRWSRWATTYLPRMSARG